MYARGAGAPRDRLLAIEGLYLWGCKPKAFPILRIVVCEKAVSVAIERIDPCMASFGVDRSVRSMMAAT